MNNNLLKNLLLFLLLVCFYYGSYSTLLKQQVKDDVSLSMKSSVSSWNLPPIVLSFIAGEFKGLVADYMLLDAGAQLGTKLVKISSNEFRTVKKEYDWLSFHRLFVACQVLDPSFSQTYILAQGWLPWDANMVNEMNSILEVAALNRPWDWRPLRTIGFNHYYFFENYDEAGRLFLEAAKVPNAPFFLSIVGSRLSFKGGQSQTAVVMLKSMLNERSESDPGYIQIADRLKALEGVIIIENSMQQYKKQFAKLPEVPSDLLAAGLLTELPINPDNIPYCIDQEGRVYFDQPKCRESFDGK